MGIQTGFDISQVLATSYLGIRKTQELIEPGKAPGPVMAHEGLRQMLGTCYGPPCAPASSSLTPFPPQRTLPNICLTNSN